MKIEMRNIEHSSMLQAAGYDPATSTLAVQFKGGDHEHQYIGVTSHVWGLLEAEINKGSEGSVGRIFHAHVKTAGHTFTKHPITPPGG